MIHGHPITLAARRKCPGQRKASQCLYTTWARFPMQRKLLKKKWFHVTSSDSQTNANVSSQGAIDFRGDFQHVLIEWHWCFPAIIQQFNYNYGGITTCWSLQAPTCMKASCAWIAVRSPLGWLKSKTRFLRFKPLQDKNFSTIDDLHVSIQDLARAWKAPKTPASQLLDPQPKARALLIATGRRKSPKSTLLKTGFCARDIHIHQHLQVYRTMAIKMIWTLGGHRGILHLSYYCGKQLHCK